MRTLSGRPAIGFDLKTRRYSASVSSGPGSSLSPAVYCSAFALGMQRRDTGEAMELMNAVFEHGSFRPESRVELPEGTRVRLAVERIQSVPRTQVLPISDRPDRGGKAPVAGSRPQLWPVSGQGFQVASRQCRIYPVGNCAIKLQPAILDQLRQFPTGNHAHRKPLVLPLKQAPATGPQPRRIGHPPNPDMCIEQDQPRASQSSIATGSKGSS